MICLSCSGSPSFPIYISNFGNNTVVRVDPNGSVTTWTNPNLNGPTGLAVDSAGNLYVANENNNTVVKFDPSGNGTIFAQTGLSSPVGLAIDGQNNLYVANPGNSTIMKFDPNGNGSLFASFGLNGPEGITFDTHSNLYVANYWGNNIAKIDPAGNVRLFTTISNPEGLAFDSAGVLYASTSSSNNAIIKFGADGAPSTYYGANSGGSGNGLVFDSGNNLYIVYYWQNLVTEVGVNGSSFQAVGPNVLNRPIFVALVPLNLPPHIGIEPQGQVAYLGATASFSVVASGTWPLSYQWAFNGASIAGATNSSLVLTNVQMDQAGMYSVVVANPYGSVTSSNASLTVNVPPPCDPAPAGLVGWWRGEGNATDVLGGNNGTLLNGTTFSSGEVGQAFVFNGVNQLVQIPESPALDPTSALTLEAWVYVEGYSANDSVAIFGKDNPYGARQYVIGLANVAGDWVFRAHLGVSSGFNFFNGATLVRLHTWYHVAMTYDGAVLKLYVDGALDGSLAITGPVIVSSDALLIGGEPSGPWNFDGRVDEASLYNRGLAASEVQAIYGAGISGKCVAPFPPSITSQPISESVIAGQNAQFSVSAVGTQPFSFQWTYNGSAVAGATSSSLLLTNVQMNQAGVYAVQITNAAGAITSSNAVLTVSPVPPCDSAPAGLVDWWRAEGDATDSVGTLNGTLVNGTGFAPGEVGQAFSFDGRQNMVTNGLGGLMQITNSYTFEFWAWPTASRASTTETTSGIAGISNQRYAIFPHYGPAHVVGAGVSVGTNGVSVFEHGNTYLPSLLVYDVPIIGWTHIAVVYNNQQPSLYLNGVLVKTGLTSINPSFPGTNLGEEGYGYGYYAGLLDEVSIYSRGLTAAEIQAIYNAGSAGKCASAVAPAIYLQPANQAVFVGQNVTFIVGASGSHPLNYQWSFNGSAVTGATTSSLLLTNVQTNRAGMYSVVVTNAYGSATSSNVALVVNFPPATVSISPTSGTAGGLVTVPVLLAANGNENVLGFSVNFDPTLLTNAGVALGAGASGASLVFNTNLAGEVGVGVALPSGTTFAAGTQEVADITFLSVVSQTNFSTSLAFGDQPTKRELADVTANTLAVNFVGGLVSLMHSEFEADVAPRPYGNGELTVSDWAQVGRFVAALDLPTIGVGSEFQRADCAPRATLGDGLLTVSDWVQAGRYAAGLDPLTLAGGPTGPSTNLNNAVTRLVRPKGGQQRVITVQGPVLFDGQNGTMAINLQAQGDENAVGLSLAFDPTVLTYAGAGYGSDATGAAGMVINANHATNGQVGIILALPSDVSFSPGTRQILTVSFKAATAASINSALAFADLPVPREVADTNAVPLVTTYDNGTVSVNPLPSLAISHTSQSISLSWPLWATNYVLQGAASSSLPTATWTNAPVAPVMTNNALSVILPIDHTPHFYRLQHQ